MDQEQFSAELTHAQLMCDQAFDLFVACYWLGYRWGLCRKQRGENFGTPTQHAWRSVLADDPNGFAAAVGKRYRDGLKGKPS